MTIQLSTSIRNTMVDAITAAAGSNAILRLYDGTIPSSVANSITGNLLAELTCNATFAPSASGGVITLNAITPDSSANASGTATHFRLWQSNGTTPVLQGTVGEASSGADMILNSTSIIVNVSVTISGATLTAPGA